MFQMIGDEVITFSTEENDRINNLINIFTKKSNPQYYTVKRNVAENSARKNIALGKKAEFFTHFYLESLGFHTKEPDLRIFSSSDKSWDADLLGENFPNVHVKSCGFDTYYSFKDYTWTFNYSNSFGPGGKDTIFSTESQDLVAFVYLEGALDEKAYIKAIVDKNCLTQYFKLPRKEALQDIKRCIYYKDLVENRDKILGEVHAIP